MVMELTLTSMAIVHVDIKANVFAKLRDLEGFSSTERCSALIVPELVTSLAGPGIVVVDGERKRAHIPL